MGAHVRQGAEDAPSPVRTRRGSSQNLGPLAPRRLKAPGTIQDKATRNPTYTLPPRRETFPRPALPRPVVSYSLLHGLSSKAGPTPVESLQKRSPANGLRNTPTPELEPEAAAALHSSIIEEERTSHEEEHVAPGATLVISLCDRGFYARGSRAANARGNTLGEEAARLLRSSVLEEASTKFLISLSRTG